MTTDSSEACARVGDAPPESPHAPRPVSVPSPETAVRSDRGVRGAITCAAVVGCVAVLLGAAFTAAGGAAASMALSVLTVVGALALVHSACRTARAGRGRRRRLWFAVAGSGASWALVGLGAATISGQESAGADALALMACAVAAVTLLLLVPRHVGFERLRHLVGAVIIAGSVFFLGAALVPEAVAVPFDAGPFLAALSVARVLGDVVVVTLALVALTRTGRRPGAALALVVAGYVALAVADISGTAVVGAGPATVDTADVVRLAGLVALALAARAPDAASLFGPRTTGAPERPGSARSLVVYVPLLTAMVVVAGFTPRAGDMVLRVAEVVTLLLFGLRQVIIARESAKLQAQVEQRMVELRTTSASLARLASQNARTIESVSEGIVGVDPDGRVTFANAAALGMLGHPLEAVVGRAPGQTFVAREVDARGRSTQNPVAVALESGTPSGPHTAVFRRGDGTEFPVEWTAGPVAADDGGVAGAVVVFRDITQRRELERMKDEFVAVLNHELRTPLTSIRGTLGLLDGGAVGTLTSRAQSLVRRGLESSERLTRLVSDLLDVDRLELGASPLTFADTDAAPLVRSAVDGVRTLAADVPVDLREGVVGGRVNGDGDRIIQTLTNLLGNAIKFSPPGTAITVSAIPGPETVEFVVTDQGRGIPPDKIERIFERFEQADSSDARLQGGTGLGLAISRSIVRRHGGAIWVDSRPGEGASFHFTIPVAGAGAADGARAPAPVGTTDVRRRAVLGLGADDAAAVVRLTRRAAATGLRPGTSSMAEGPVGENSAV